MTYEPITAEQMRRDYVYALHEAGELVPRKPPAVSPVDRIVEFAKERGVTLEALRGPYRGRPLVYHRQDCMAMLRAKTQLSMTQIGGLFNRDHTTVLHALRSVEARATKHTQRGEG